MTEFSSGNMTAPRRWAAILALAVLYFGTRLPFLTVLPMNSEEAIHLEWTRSVRFSGSPYASIISDDKKPLPYWIVAPFLPSDGDGLLAGRLFGILCGFGVLAVTCRIARRWMGGRVAVLTAVFCIAAPELIFHERMFLVDPLMGLLFVLTVWYSLRLSEAADLRTAAKLGLVIGCALVSKSYGYFYLLFPALAFLVRGNARELGVRRVAAALALAYGLSAFILAGVMAYPLVRYGHGLFHDRGYFMEASMTFREILVGFQRSHGEILQTFWHHITPGILLMWIGGLIRGVLSSDRPTKFLALASFLPLLVMAVVAKVVYARFLYFFTPLMLLMAASFLVWLTGRIPRPALRRIALTAAAISALLLPLRNDALLVADPSRAPMPPMDAWGYIYGTLSGYGVDEVAAFLEGRAAEGPITVLTTDHIGNVRDGLAARLWYKPDIRLLTAGWAYRHPVLEPVRRYGAVQTTTSRHVRDAVTLTMDDLQRAYFVLNAPDVSQDYEIHLDERRFLFLNPDARPVFLAQKPHGRHRIVVFEL